MHPSPDQRHHAALPVFRLCRDRRRARARHVPGARRRGRALAGLQHRASALAQLRDEAHRPAERHLSGVSRALREADDDGMRRAVPRAMP